MANREKKNQKIDKNTAELYHSRKSRKHGWRTYVPARIRKVKKQTRVVNKEIYAYEINNS